MKSIYTTISAVFSMLIFSFATHAQESWPKTIKGSDGSSIKLYQFQPESFSNNQLKASAAISITKEGSSDPVFGVAWLEALTTTNGDKVQIESIKINSIKLPGDVSDDALDALQSDLEDKSSEMNITVPLADLQSSLELNNQQQKLSGQISTKAPKVIYSTSPSILVLIDGEPRLQHNKEWNAEAVVNTPFTLVKNEGKYYLHGGKHWYMAPSPKGPYSMTTTVPQQLRKIEESNRANDKGQNDDAEEKDENTIYKIIVSTEPAELIQSTGEAKFAPLENSGLLYVSNSGDDIFMDVSSQDYYVLISGRWYHSKTLSGSWEYTGSDKLPDDFAKIPEGSPKDHVLASIAGTDAANDALQEAAVPQTAKVDRKSAQADVTYDGDPQFQDIDGTDLDYAVNTPASVLRWRGRYYSVDNGVWFESARATGPWAVSETRPYPVALIPPSYPVYHMKYVYIYDVTPDYVYMGYTPGYLNTFVYGPTVVYGTGYYYRPWFGTHYYARPYTWGFNVRYNPWIGWGIGYNYSAGWFNIGFGAAHRPWGYWGGGWWGPRSYRPAYCWSPYRYGGSYYGRNTVYYNRTRNYNIVNRNYSGNIYRNRGGIVSRDYRRADYNDRYRGNRNPSWSSNRNNRYNDNRGNRFNDNRSNNRFNDGRNNNRYNDNRSNRNDDNRDNRNNNNRFNNNNRPGSRPDNNATPGNRNDRPVREYNPSNRNDPYGRNNRISGNDGNNRPTPERSNGRYNNTNRDPYNNRNSNPNPSVRPQGEMPGGDRRVAPPINRPERGDRFNNNRNDNRSVSPQPQRQYQPQQRREVQRREPSAAPAMRQREQRISSPAPSGGRSERGGGGSRGGESRGGGGGSRGEGGRPGRN